MRVHNLKCWPDPFQAMWDGTKVHEVRVNDRDYQVGDALQLHEWRIDAGTYTGRQLRVVVTYITPGGTFGLPDNLCVMSVRVP